MLIKSISLTRGLARLKLNLTTQLSFLSCIINSKLVIKDMKLETQTGYLVKCIYFKLFQSKTTSHLQTRLVKTKLRARHAVAFSFSCNTRKTLLIEKIIRILFVPLVFFRLLWSPFVPWKSLKIYFSVCSIGISAYQWQVLSFLANQILLFLYGLFAFTSLCGR